MLASWPKAQCVGATGSCAFGSIRCNRSGLSRAASTRMSAVCTTRLRLRSDRPFTDAQRSSSDRYLLVIGPVEPFGRHPPVPLTPAHIHFPATSPRRLTWIQNFYNAHRLSPVTGAGSHSPSPKPVVKATSPSLTLKRGCEGRLCGTM